MGGLLGNTNGVMMALCCILVVSIRTASASTITRPELGLDADERQAQPEHQAAAQMTAMATHDATLHEA